MLQSIPFIYSDAFQLYEENPASVEFLFFRVPLVNLYVSSNYIYIEGYYSSTVWFVVECFCMVCVCGKGGGGGGRGRLKITLAVDMSFKEVIENIILDIIE